MTAFRYELGKDRFGEDRRSADDPGRIAAERERDRAIRRMTTGSRLGVIETIDLIADAGRAGKAGATERS